MSSGFPSNFRLPETERFENRSDQSFNHWQTLIQDAATSRGIMGYLNGSVTKPTNNYVDPDDYTATPWFSKKPFNEEWEMRDAYAHGLVIGNLVNPVGLGISRNGSAAYAWAELNVLYGGKTDLDLNEVERKLRTTFYDGISGFQDHMMTMRALWDAANSQGANLQDTEFRRLIVSSVPHSFNPVIPSLTAYKTSAEVIVHLTSWDRIINEQKNSVTTATSSTQALATTSNRRSDRSGLKCTNPLCNKSGHTIDNCFMSGGGRAGQ